MPLIAHASGGLIDSTLADLGIGASWQSVHRVRPRVALCCTACGRSMHAKVSPLGLRFFAHDAAQRDCPLNGETAAHRLLKSAIAAAVRRAGWHAELEAAGPGQRWRADVLAVSPDGSRRVAWEAQLAQQHVDETRARTARYAEDGVEVVWVFDRLVVDDLPAVTVELDQHDIQVAGPVARLVVERCPPEKCSRYSDLPSRPPCPGHGRWEAVTLPLDVFVGLICRDDAVHTVLPPADLSRREPTAPRFRGFTPRRWWTSPAYLQHADTVRHAQADTDASMTDLREQLQQKQERDVRRQATAAARRAKEAQQHEARVAALLERQQQLQPIVEREVNERTGTTPWVLKGDPEQAMGVSVLCGSLVVAVICPVASRITTDIAERLAEVTVYVASNHEKRAIASLCRPDQRFVVVSDPSPGHA
ncbi:competence protein CoiA family protein [Actinoplanes sp. NPDC026623]|uniref:competence protein CoiA n=1 Tax=Actinoplanes sp. NPDC026623 TaxID=3155610 RepID=UPI0033EF3B75